ncbi:MAG: radical SAM protein [Candidatus Aminicenantes bacterium]|nr:radical SAM protein [Candidatus Aminicenantes bacterium]
MIVREVEAKSVLNKSKIYDYCVNAYTGCQVGCRYCYARLFIPRYSGHAEPWGTFVDVKVNAPDVLRRQLRRGKQGEVWVSSVCDCYQPLEAKYGLTRRCLEALLEVQWPVRVQTKSVLALRDLDLFRQFRDLEVAFTIATDDERTARLFEPHASPVSERIAALGRLREAGVRTMAFIGPILPGDPAQLADALAGKVDRVLVDRMNYIDQLRGFYERNGLNRASTEKFFREMKERCASEFAKRDIPYELLF